MLEKHILHVHPKVSLTYYTLGKSPKVSARTQHTLIFLHGLSNEAMSWESLVPYFDRDDCYCLFLDFPGHGESSLGDFSYHISFYAAALGAFIDKLGLSNVTVIGHSLGGQAALYYSIHHGRNVEKMILIAPAGFETFNAFESIMLKNMTAIPQSMSVYLRNIKSNPRANKYIKVDKFLDDPAALQVIARSMTGMLDEPVYKDLHRIKKPVLVIFGDNDKAIPNPVLHGFFSTKDVAIKGTNRMPNAQLELIKGGGHFVHLEQPMPVATLMLAFLMEIPAYI
jgi:pimeloyl-ACP methyl ester carboxylesterase